MAPQPPQRSSRPVTARTLLGTDRESGVVAPPAIAELGETELLQIVLAQPLPTHVAIIMDGNGRWATRRGFPRVAGHREGVKTARAVFRAADALGLRYLTLYAFSTENWTRPEDEVATLMRLLEEAIVRELPELMSRNARLRVIGRSHGVPLPVRRGIDRVVQATQHNTGLNLTMAFNYGGREELLDAFRALAERVRSGELEPRQISQDHVSDALYTGGLPDPDLLIRTSGEMRVSNFLLWQIAYTELWVTRTLWPDFGPLELYRALAEFQGRTRRFGGV
jgi:undecaprenyl diphosphate synthase